MTSETEIDELTAAFFAEFDNREGRRPSAVALHQMFAAEARIVRISGKSIESMTPTEFIEPRIALLNNGDLKDFHEWEVEGTTRILGNIAARTSTYAKHGISDGMDFAGKGRKTALFHRASGRWLISSLLWEDD